MELLKRYRSIVVADQTYTVDQVNDLVPATYEEAVSWIEKELKECAGSSCDLFGFLLFRTGPRYPGFALRRARLLLYAASPLNNPSNDKAKYGKSSGRCPGIHYGTILPKDSPS